MKDGIGKVIAVTAAASMVCEVPLPAMVDEVVVADPRDPGTDAFVDELEQALGREIAIDAGDLPQAFEHETYLPETQDPDAPQAPSRPEWDYPR